MLTRQLLVQGTLQAQFAVNYVSVLATICGPLLTFDKGLPYKFVVPSESLAFNVACDAIHRVLGRLTWATQSAVASMKDTTEDPNELLVLGYQEGQKIGVRLSHSNRAVVCFANRTLLTIYLPSIMTTVKTPLDRQSPPSPSAHLPP